MVLASLLLLGCMGTSPRSVGAMDGRCAECHAPQAASHLASGHGHAGAEPFYEATRASWAAEHGTGAACDSCHLPSHGTDDGLSCGSCHAAWGNRAPADGALLHDWNGPVRGPRFNENAPHDVVTGELLMDGELCGTCHEISGPPAFEERLFTNWLTSPAAARGERCQDCHMRDHDIVRDDKPPLLRVADGELVVTAAHDGHAWPDGASFLREVAVVVDGPSPRRWWLSTRLFRGDTEVADPAVADRQELHHLAAGESRTFPLPADWTRVCVTRREAREDLAQQLGLTIPPAQELACLSP